MKIVLHILISCMALIAAFSCSTTRVLQDGDYRLARNKINITNDKEFSPNTLEPYLKQKPNPAITLSYMSTTGQTAREKDGTRLFKELE